MPNNQAKPLNSAALQRAWDSLERQDYRAAHEAAMQAFKADPSNGAPLVILGMIAAAHDNHAKAIEAYARALSIGGADAEALTQRARSLIALNRRSEALDDADAAAQLELRDAHTLDTLGVVYSRAGRHDLALDFYAQATSLAPRVANFHYNHATALQFLGKMDEARAAFERCLDLDPDDVRAYTGRVQITRQTEAANEIDRLLDVFARIPESDTTGRLHVGHALAKAYEDLGDAEQAMTWLARAKAGKAKELAYTADMDHAIFDAAMATASLTPTSGYSDAAPVFIVGMPRTGTTLVDRILSSHSTVSSAGELTDFGLILKRMSGTRSRHVLDAETLRAASGLDATTWGRDYVAAVSRLTGQSGRIIDKMPLNAVYSALILRALPNARVICLRRHPADTVLSNYRQLFATGFSYYNYAYDLADTARYYLGFDRMIAHFRTHLPANRFTEVSYEGLVDTIEAETRRLLAFCDLEFEQACVDFHENTAPVATASSAQVRQPLYRSALARWKRYEPWLGAALDVLRDGGLTLD